MPPRKNKRKFQDDEQLDKAEKNSKWATLLSQQQHDQEEIDASDLYQKPNKEIFTFDFSKEHLLLNQKETVRKEEPKIVLTPQEQKQLERRLAKERKEKEEKEKLKREKKNQRKKELQKQKEEEKLKREEEEKQEQQLEKVLQSNKNKGGDTKLIFYTLAILFVILGALQYQKDIYVKLSKFRFSGEVNYYEVLETSSGMTELQLKSQYKKLVLKYHPDKNPNCHTCKEKFEEIMQAWQVLGNPEKRQHYDKNSGYINQIPSASLTLNAENYHHLLGDSDDIWIVEVYDSTSQYCHYFAKFWEEAVQQHKNIVRFGRIDVWQQSDMKSYIPYRFQIFPGLYSVHRGEEELCQLDFDRPIKSVEACIEARVKESKSIKIKDWSQIPETPLKKAVIIGGAVKIGTRMKILHAKYQRYYNFYVISNSETLARIKGTDHKIDFSTEVTKRFYDNYQKFLRSNIVQQKSMCQVHVLCKDAPCILILEKSIIGEQIIQYPLIEVKEREEFAHKIEVIKNMTGLYQKFQLGLYQDGKLQLGNFDELDELNPERGEVIDLVCVASTLLRTVFKLITSAIGEL